MKRSIRLFMTPEDESQFMAVSGGKAFERENKWEFHWKFGEKFVQFNPCEQTDGAIVVGYLSIWTQDTTDDAKAAESAFRKLERYIEKNYLPASKTRRTKSPPAEGSVKGVWVGPGAHTSGRTLVQNKNGIVEYLV